MNKLPISEDVLVMKMFPYMDRFTLIKLKSTCKYFSSLIPDCNIENRRFWRLTDSEVSNFELGGDTQNWNRQMYLLSTPKRGCEHCGKKRVRKIYWEYKIRMCKKCKINLTTSSFRLFKLGLPRMYLTDLSYINYTLWRRFIGSYTLKFYLKKDIVPLLVKHYKLDSNLTKFEEIEGLIKVKIDIIKQNKEQEKKLEAKRLKDEQKTIKVNMKRKQLEEWEKLDSSIKKEKRRQEILDYCNGVIPTDVLLNLQQFKKFVKSKSLAINVNKRAWLIKFQDEINIQV